MVSSTPQPHFTPGKDPVPILQEADWAPGPVWKCGKSRPHRDSIPDLPTRSSVAIPTELLGPQICRVYVFNQDVEFGCCRFYLYKKFLLVFVCFYVILVYCLLNVFLKGFRGIFIQMYYLIFFYKCIDFMFRCIFIYCDHGSTFICFRYFLPV